jgi:hypothetical protein
MFVYPAHAANNACHKRRLTTARKNNCAIASQAFACKPTFFLGRTWASKHLEGMYCPAYHPPLADAILDQVRHSARKLARTEESMRNREKRPRRSPPG